MTLEGMDIDALEALHVSLLKSLQIVREERRRRRRMATRIMAAVFGAPCAAYQFTAQRHCGGIATDGDDPPSRTL